MGGMRGMWGVGCGCVGHDVVPIREDVEAMNAGQNGSARASRRAKGHTGRRRDPTPQRKCTETQPQAISASPRRDGTASDPRWNHLVEALGATPRRFAGEGRWGAPMPAAIELRGPPATAEGSVLDAMRSRTMA